MLYTFHLFSLLSLSCCITVMGQVEVGRAIGFFGSQCGVSEYCGWKLTNTFIDNVYS
jgi:hypothetical protein